jgi:hypothetical protein
MWLPIGAKNFTAPSVTSPVPRPPQSCTTSARYPMHRRDLLVGQCPHEAQFAEHFHVFFVMRGGLADRLLAGGRDVELVAEREALAEFELDAARL